MKEIEEILDFLEKEKDYAIFAGFAGHILLGTEFSPDIDILVPSMEEAGKKAERIGWKRIQTRYPDMITVEKNKITFDICMTINRAFIESSEVIEYEGRKLRVITPEALFITKMNNQISSPNRTEEKRQRDSKVINELRKRIDIDKLNELISKLRPEFWTERRW